MHYFITNVSFNLLVKEFLKSMNIWQSFRQKDWLCHMTHLPQDICPQRRRTHKVSKITCVLRTEAVANRCYIYRQINETLLSTNIILLYTSFDLMTDRLTPSVTDRLLIMYSILLQHLYLCYRSCVPSILGFFIRPMWTSFCYWLK